MIYTLKPHDIKYLVVSASDISAFHFIKLISGIEGELQSVRSKLLLDSIFMEYGLPYPENYLRDTEYYIQRYVFLMTERMSEAEELGLIPD
ncbi:hypothetical protein [Kosakonia sp. MUSA4]|uniref:hypothetical protein n=1 Tax=Kosakonia sp. MUSA4 TaxID=2067958 RepID=UPI0015986B0D|nr:hypothetical protein [Kosakonia sp. MUSA4]QJT82546.1 hypothetical protein C0557_21930 [Kosakonia sp. MUSA4]